MAIFNSYVKLPEGKTISKAYWVVLLLAALEVEYGTS